MKLDWSKGRIDAIRNKYANLNDGDFNEFLETCKSVNLDPLSRHIYAMPRGGKLSILVSIDGFRLVAQRTTEYEGQTPTMWCGDDGKWVDVWLNKQPPKAAKVGVNRKGFKEPLYAIAVWDSYNQNSPIWRKMPDLMLAKCAESLALRKAFPAELSGLYTEDEMGQDQNKPMAGKMADVMQDAIEEDFPIPPEEKIPGPNYRVLNGKLKGKLLKDVHQDELKAYEQWLSKTLNNGKAQPWADEVLKAIRITILKNDLRAAISEKTANFEDKESVNEVCEFLEIDGLKSLKDILDEEQLQIYLNRLGAE